MQKNLFYFYNFRQLNTQDRYYFKCQAPEETRETDSLGDVEPKIGKFASILPIANRYNIHNGGTPYVPIVVEHIPEYFTEDDWQTCVANIRTIGTVRRLENEFYEIESLDEGSEVRVSLSRGTNRELRVLNDEGWLFDPERTRQSDGQKKFDNPEHKGLLNVTKKTDDVNHKTVSKPKKSTISFPHSLSEITDPSVLGDARVEDGKAYIVLGKLQWSNNAPIINVDRFIPVHNLKTTYSTFQLQYTVARRHVDYFKAHFSEIREIIRRPEEQLNPSQPHDMKRLGFDESLDYEVE